MTPYVTTDGDTVDLVAFKQYGNSLLGPVIAQANQAYIPLGIFKGGVTLVIPVVSESSASVANLPPWANVTTSNAA